MKKTSKKITNKRKVLLLTTLGLSMFTIPMVAQKTIFLDQVSALEKGILDKPSITLDIDSLELTPEDDIPNWDDYVSDENILDSNGNPATFENVVVDDSQIDSDGDKKVDDMLEGSSLQVIYTLTDPITSTKTATDTLDIIPVGNVPTLTLKQSEVEISQGTTGIDWLGYVDVFEDNGKELEKNLITIDGGTIDSDLDGNVDATATDGNITYTYTDSVGNIVQEILKVTVVPEITSPTLELTKDPVILAPGDIIDWTDYIIVAKATDGSDITDISYLDVSAPTIDSDNNQEVDPEATSGDVIYTLTDPFDSTKTATKTLSVKVGIPPLDTVAPAIKLNTQKVQYEKDIVVSQNEWLSYVQSVGDDTDELSISDVEVTTENVGTQNPITKDTTIKNSGNVEYTLQDLSGNSYTTSLEVEALDKDTTAPILELETSLIEVEVGQTITKASWREYIKEVSDDTTALSVGDVQIDASDVDEDLDGIIDADPGEHVVLYNVVDAAGNETQKELTVKVVIRDTVAPAIKLNTQKVQYEKDIVVSQNEWLSYVQSVGDDIDELSISDVEVDASEVGTQNPITKDTTITKSGNVKYTLQDLSGNIYTTNLEVEVIEKSGGIVFTKEVTGGSGVDQKALEGDTLSYTYTITNDSFSSGGVTDLEDVVLTDVLDDIDIDNTTISNLEVKDNEDNVITTTGDILTGLSLGDIATGQSIVVTFDIKAANTFDTSLEIDSQAYVEASNYTKLFGKSKEISEEVVDIYKDMTPTVELENGVRFTKTLTDQSGDGILEQGEKVHYKYEIENVAFDNGSESYIEGITLKDPLDTEDLDIDSIDNIIAYKNEELPVLISGDITSGMTFTWVDKKSKLDTGDKLKVEFDVDAKDKFLGEDDVIDSSATLEAGNYTAILAQDRAVDILKAESTITNLPPQLELSTNEINLKKGDVLTKSDWLEYIVLLTDDNDDLTLGNVILDVSEVDANEDGIIDANAGSYSVSYTVSDLDGLSTTKVMTVNIFEETDGILFTKTVSGGSGKDQKALPSDTLTYVYEIENSNFDSGVGSTTLEDVVLTDTLLDDDLDRSTINIISVSNTAGAVDFTGTIDSGLNLGDLALGDTLEVKLTIDAAAEFDASEEIDSQAYVEASNYTKFLRTSKKISEDVIDIYKDMEILEDKAPTLELTTSNIQVLENSTMSKSDWKNYIAEVYDDNDDLTLGDVQVDVSEVDGVGGGEEDGIIDAVPGKYAVFYKVVDKSGNETQKELEVEVVALQDGIGFIKEVTGGSGQDGKAIEGDTLSYSYTISNESFLDITGNNVLENVSLIDTLDDIDLEKTSLTNLKVVDSELEEIIPTGSLDSGLKIGDIQQGQNIVVTFDINAASNFDDSIDIDTTAIVEASNYGTRYKEVKTVEEEGVDIYKDIDGDLPLDLDPPTIEFEGFDSIQVKKNSTMSQEEWKSIAKVSDAVDGDIPLENIEVDASEVDSDGDEVIDAEVSSTPYMVHYTAYDSAGNEAQKDLPTIVVDENYENKAPIITLSTSKVSFAKGDSEPDWIDYVQSVEDEGGLSVDDVVVDASDVDMNTDGSYEVLYSLEDSEGLKGNAVLRVIVGDVNEIPEISLYDSEITLLVGDDEPDWSDYIKDVSDNFDDLDKTDVIIDDSAVDMNVVGSYTVKYTVSDSDGNSNYANLKVNIEENLDNSAIPTINLSVDQVSLYVGSSMPNWLDYVTSVSDDEDDLDISDLIIDDTNVDLDQVGEYSVVYSLSDSDLNTTTKTMDVLVVEKDITDQELTNTAITNTNILISLLAIGIAILGVDKKKSKK